MYVAFPDCIPEKVASHPACYIAGCKALPKKSGVSVGRVGRACLQGANRLCAGLVTKGRVHKECGRHHREAYVQGGVRREFWSRSQGKGDLQGNVRRELCCLCTGIPQGVTSVPRIIVFRRSRESVGRLALDNVVRLEIDISHYHNGIESPHRRGISVSH